MTPGQARGMLLGFACVLAGVAANAIYLQDPVRGLEKRAKERSGVPRVALTVPPAMSAPHAHAEAPRLSIARFAPDPARGEGVGDSADAETVRAIQRELASRGFGPVPSDGSLGLATRAAIMAYEYDQGLALTAAPSAELLQRLVLGAENAQPPLAQQATARVASPEAEQVITAIQRSLALLGYQPGRPDGRLGEETVRAVRDFEVDRGMVPKGRVSAELVRQLSEAVQRARR